MRNSGMTNKEVEAKLRIAPRRAEDFWTQVKIFTSPFPEGLWPATWKTDQRMKLSRGDKGLLLEEYVLRLLGNREENRPYPQPSFRRGRGGG